MWSSSSFQRLLQRHPSGPTQAQRPPSRFHTARRTIAGIVEVASGDLAAVGSGRCVFRSGATAPLRLPCFSMAQRIASRSTAARSPSGILCERRDRSVSRSSLQARSRVTRSDQWLSVTATVSGLRLGLSLSTSRVAGDVERASGTGAAGAGAPLDGAARSAPASGAVSGSAALAGSRSGSFRIPARGAARAWMEATRCSTSARVRYAARATFTSP